MFGIYQKEFSDFFYENKTPPIIWKFVSYLSIPTKHVLLPLSEICLFFILFCCSTLVFLFPSVKTLIVFIHLLGCFFVVCFLMYCVVIIS